MYVLKVNNIGKIYRIYSKPIDRLKEVFLRKRYHREFPALTDISFTALQGQTIGIVGDNGAGKSTLLKIISGTLSPTHGQLDIKGRVFALLELGAGFHPDFTGRENIFINGAIFGLQKDEIKKKQDEIIAFSELEKFIDQPVKTYSSGMYVRLAFSIATCLDPEILIIDEALSVGDQHFQKKCTDRMMEFKSLGKTIIFCSHSMYHVNQLCSEALWLEGGKIHKRGAALEITTAYENHVRQKAPSQEKAQFSSQPNELIIFFKEIRLNGSDNELTIETGQDLEVELQYESLCDKPFQLAVGIRRNDELVCHAVSMEKDDMVPLKGPARGTVRLRYHNIPLLHGDYYVTAAIVDEHGIHLYHRKESNRFTITSPASWEQEIGLIRMDYSWEVL